MFPLANLNYGIFSRTIETLYSFCFCRNRYIEKVSSLYQTDILSINSKRIIIMYCDIVIYRNDFVIYHFKLKNINKMNI